jgi:hypothetical protein
MLLICLTLNTDVQVKYSVHFRFAVEPSNMAQKIINNNSCFPSNEADILVSLLITAKVRLSGTLGEWGVTTDRFCH